MIDDLIHAVAQADRNEKRLRAWRIKWRHATGNDPDELRLAMQIIHGFCYPISGHWPRADEIGRRNHAQNATNAQIIPMPKYRRQYLRTVGSGPESAA